MSRKCVHSVDASIGQTSIIVKVYRDSELREFVARLYVNGELQPAADYHTDDKGDAIETAIHMAGHRANQCANV